MLPESSPANLGVRVHLAGGPSFGSVTTRAQESACSWFVFGAEPQQECSKDTLGTLSGSPTAPGVLWGQQQGGFHLPGSGVLRHRGERTNRARPPLRAGTQCSVQDGLP